MRPYRCLSIFSLCILISLSSVKAFIASRGTNTYKHKPTRANRSRALFYADSNEMNPEFVLSTYQRDSFNTFLTQRSIQSFLCILRDMKDIHTIRWLEEFTQPTDYVPEVKHHESRMKAELFEDPTGDSRLLRYHGLSALNSTIFPTWESYFKALINSPPEYHLIESKYKHVPDYELDIEPAKICSRIISVREQIAKEFIKDLDVITQMGFDAMRGFYENIRSDDFDSEKLIPRQSLMFLEYEETPSPLRKGNFDLLKLLATQESIYRVLEKDFKDSGGDRLQKDAMKHFLVSFLSERIESHLTGYQKFDRADDLLEELLSSTPQLIPGTFSVIDPTGIAKLILTEREHVVLDWKECAKSVPLDHTEIRRLQLNAMMGNMIMDIEEENVFQ